MEVTLEEDNEMLEEVVVIGYGTVKRKDVTTAVSTVSTDDVQRRPLVSAGQALQGKAAGVAVIQPTGQPGGEMSIRVRGTTSFNGSNDPLYVVDGVPVDNLKFLSPNDIASMQILKDASSLPFTVRVQQTAWCLSLQKPARRAIRKYHLRLNLV